MELVVGCRFVGVVSLQAQARSQLFYAVDQQSEQLAARLAHPLQSQGVRSRSHPYWTLRWDARLGGCYAVAVSYDDGTNSSCIFQGLVESGMSNNYKKIADVYKSTERNALVESEDPHKLVLVMFDALIKSIEIYVENIDVKQADLEL